MNKIFIVAEIGVNHNGDTDMGKKLIDAARKAGADAVKTQLFVAEQMTSAGTRKAGYQAAATGGSESQLDMLKRLELSAEKYSILDKYAKSAGIIFFAAPFDMESIKVMLQLGSPIIKVPSGEITNLPYLMKIARTGKKIFLSTGMSTMDEVLVAAKVLTGNGKSMAAVESATIGVSAAAAIFADSPSKLTLLHCHTQYPTEF